jgi:hypothetical protein
MDDAAAIRVSNADALSGPAATELVAMGQLGAAGEGVAAAAAAAAAAALPLPRDLFDSMEAVLEVRDRPENKYQKRLDDKYILKSYFLKEINQNKRRKNSKRS